MDFFGDPGPMPLLILVSMELLLPILELGPDPPKSSMDMEFCLDNGVAHLELPILDLGRRSQEESW